MTRIFISHSHSDEAIAHKLLDFLIAAFPEFREEDILCTSLSFKSNTISDQLKSNLKVAKALVALITKDSLRSPWIPFEIGSFWPTEKTIVLILGPGLNPEKLPGPLRGWLSISIENGQAFEQLNQVINQLERELEIRQNVNRSRRDRFLEDFITIFKAWESKLTAAERSQQQEIEQFKTQIQELERSHSQELEDKKRSLEVRIEQLEKELEEARSQVEQVQDQERSHNEQLEEIKAASQQEKEELEQNYQNQKQKLEQSVQSLQSEIKQVKEQLAQERSQAAKQIQDLEQSHKQQLKKLEEVKGEKGQAQHFTEKLGNDINLEMIAIPGGKFMMGSPEGEGEGNERPQHEVTVQAFYMGKYPITQAQYQKVMGKNTSYFKGDYRPVESVSWDEAVEFCQRLSHQTGKEYRLPNEAEWEYACRAGTTTAYYCGDTITGELANYAGSETTAVGKYSPNAFGLYDMHGNVWEWCQDDWHESYNNAPTDGRAWLLGGGSKKYIKYIRLSEASSNKAIRGGSWFNDPDICRSAYHNYNTRDFRNYYIGFRVVCVAPRIT